MSDTPLLDAYLAAKEHNGKHGHMHWCCDVCRAGFKADVVSRFSGEMAKCYPTNGGPGVTIVVYRCSYCPQEWRMDVPDEVRAEHYLMHKPQKP